MRRRLLPVDASVAIAIAAMVGATARAQSLVHDLRGADRSEFGWSIAFVGDLDGDGTSELAIGSVPETAPGYVTLFSGATGAVLRVHVSTQIDDFFGFSVAGVGDVDGDGVPDYAAGAPHWFVSSGFDGSTVVYSGKSGALLWSVLGGPDEQLGFSIAGVGDVDGNGRPEVLIGRMGVDGFSLFDGGGAPLLAVEERDGNALGWSVAGAGDLDGDGVADFLVGEPWHDVHSAAAYRGRVRIYSGATLTWIANATGAGAGDRFGVAVAATGDVDRDGLCDFVAGAPFERTNGGGSGSLVQCRSDGSRIWDVKGTAVGDWLGYSAAGVGDVDGDGTPDCAAGAPQIGNGGVGRVLLLSGADGHELFDFEGDPSRNVIYARSVAGGDVDGDGIGDVAIGDDDWTDATGQLGQAQLFLGCPASWSSYDAGWPGTNGVPSFTARGDPGLGGPVTLALEDSSGVGTTALLLLGFARANVPTHADGTLLVVPALFVPMAVPAAGLDLTGAIPDDPQLAFLRVDLQAIELDAGASHGLSFTAGLELVLGFDLP